MIWGLPKQTVKNNISHSLVSCERGETVRPIAIVITSFPDLFACGKTAVIFRYPTASPKYRESRKMHSCWLQALELPTCTANMWNALKVLFVSAFSSQNHRSRQPSIFSRLTLCVKTVKRLLTRGTAAIVPTSPRILLLCAFLGHSDVRNGDSPAIGEGTQQMPVHHGLWDSGGLSAGAEAEGRAQWTVTSPSLCHLSLE